MSNEQRPKIDKRLKGVVTPVAQRVFEKGIEPHLIELGLIDEEGNPKGSLTQDGLDGLLKTYVHGISVSFASSKVSSPAGVVFEEIELADRIVQGFGQAQVTTDGNQLKLTFDGAGPLITSMEVPLDPTKKKDKDAPDSKVSVSKLDLTGYY